MKYSDDYDETLDIIIEVPKGGRNKYEYDFERGMIRFDRMLFSAVHYPCDYGFVVDTLAGDGDPLDAMVLVWEPTFPGCLIRTRPIGMLMMEDDKGPDEKILCVPIADPMWNTIEKLDAVPHHLLREIEHFFEIYKELEAKKTVIHGWQGLEEAWKAIRESQDKYRKVGPPVKMKK